MNQDRAKRPLAVFCFMFTAAMLVTNLCENIFVLKISSAVCLLLCSISFLIKNRERRKNTLICIFGVLFAFLIFIGEYNIIVKPTLEYADKENCMFDGYVTDISDEFGKYTLKLTAVNGEKVFGCYMNLYSKNSDIYVGDLVEFTATAHTYKGDGGLYDSRHYCYAKGIYLYASTDVPVVKQNGYAKIITLCSKLRINIGTILENQLDESASVKMKAILLGDKSDFTQIQSDMFAKTGISHLFAVSGMHLALLIGFISLVFKFFILPKKVIAGVDCIVVMAFMTFMGFSPSVVRSGIMAVVMACSVLAERKSDMLTSVAFAGFVICLLSPYAVSGVSFQLSYLCVISIAVFFEPLYNVFIRFLLKHKLYNPLTRMVFSSVALSLCTVFMTSPVTMLSFGTVSMISPLSNLLIIPVASAMYVLTIMAVVFCKIEMIGNIFALLVNFINRYIDFVIRLISSSPLASVKISGGAVITVFVFVIFMILLCKLFKPKTKAIMVVLIFFLSAFAIVPGIFETSETDGKLVFAALDVGQGECLVLIKQRKAVIVDCGSDSSSYVAQEAVDYLVDNNVSKVEAVICTHMHTDHMNALSKLTENITVENVYLPRCYENTEQGKLLKASMNALCNIEIVTEDMILNIFDNAIISIYTEQSDEYFADNEDDLNKLSMAVFVDYNESEILLSGDMPYQCERNLVKTAKNIDADILKVGHHGSKTSSDLTYLNAVSPSIAVICCGNNEYGLPNDGIVKRIKNYVGDNYYTTCEDGTVEFLTDGDGIFEVKSNRSK